MTEREREGFETRMTYDIISLHKPAPTWPALLVRRSMATAAVSSRHATLTASKEDHLVTLPTDELLLVRQPRQYVGQEGVIVHLLGVGKGRCIEHVDGETVLRRQRREMQNPRGELGEIGGVVGRVRRWGHRR